MAQAFFQPIIDFWTFVTIVSVAAGVADAIILLCLVVLPVRQRATHPKKSQQPHKIVVVPMLTQEQWDAPVSLDAVEKDAGTTTSPNLLTQLGGAMRYQASQSNQGSGEAYTPLLLRPLRVSTPFAFQSPDDDLNDFDAEDEEPGQSVHLRLYGPLYEQESELPPAVIEIEEVPMFPEELDGYLVFGKRGFTAREWIDLYPTLEHLHQQWQWNLGR